MKTVAIIGTFDTKGEEFAYVASRFKELGVNTLTIHCGVFDPQTMPDVPNTEVTAAIDIDLSVVVEKKDRAFATETMTRGVEKLLPSLYANGRFDGVFSMGGSGGTTIATAGMRKPVSYTHLDVYKRQALDVRVNAKTPGGFWLQKETDSHIRKKLQPSMERRPVMAKLRAGRLCLPCGAIVLVARDACPRNPAQGGFVCRMERSCLSRETRARRSPRGMCLPCGAIAPACRSALSPERETGPRPTPRTCP